MKKIFFFNYYFFVAPQVFHPRYETEQLVDLTRYYAQILPNSGIGLEIGCGSGVIVLSLAKLFPKWHFEAFDINDRAIKLATLNQNNLNISNVSLIHQDFFTFTPKNKYQLIIANFPYLDCSEWYQQSILDWDPKSALFSDDHGLSHFRRFFQVVEQFLAPNYLIALEIGTNQAQSVIALIQQYLPTSNFKIKKDYNNLDRFIFIYK